MLKVPRPQLHSLKVISAIFALSVLGCSLALAESNGISVCYDAPILSVWRDPRAFLVLGTDYGNFYYIYDAEIDSVDGTKTLHQTDKGAALLKAILSHNDGMPVRLHVSTLAQGVVVGLNEVTAPLEPISVNNSSEQDQ